MPTSGDTATIAAGSGTLALVGATLQLQGTAMGVSLGFLGADSDVLAIPVRSPINGASVAQAGRSRVDCWHVELP